MQLGDFIRDTLEEIVFGVHSARVSVGELAAIAPGTLNDETIEVKTEVTFEAVVAVTDEKKSTKEGKAGGGAKIRMMTVEATIGASAGGSAEGRSTTENTQRISFTVPVLLNSQMKNTTPEERKRVEDIVTVRRAERDS